jgi:hypothetical protein
MLIYNYGLREKLGHVQLTIMIDAQQQYIKLNIHSEISIIVVQAHSGRKRDTCIFLWLPVQ